MRIVTINGVKTKAPKGALYYKYTDPTEPARWIYSEEDAEDIRREDPNLLEQVELL